MAIIYANSMDHYGPAVATNAVSSNSATWVFNPDIILGDSWAGDPTAPSIPFFRGTGQMRLESPLWGSRRGDLSLVADSFEISPNTTTTTVITQLASMGMRLVIPGASASTRLVHFAFSCSDLPVVDTAHGQIAAFTTSGGAISFRLCVDTTGRLMITDSAPLTTVGNTPVQGLPAILLRSAAPVIQPLTWYYISMRIVKSVAGMALDVYIGDITAGSLVLTGTGLNVGTADILGITFLPTSFRGAGGQSDLTQRAIRDIVICNTAGSYNNDLLGQVFVSAQEMRTEDNEGDNWLAYPRENIGQGVLDHQTNRTGVRFADAAALTVAAADFTFETFARFSTLPTGAATMTLLSKWREAAGLRSYMLYYDGATASLVWQVSTTGANTIVVKRLPWVPVTDHWYHVAVSRASSETMVFIDGVQLCVPLADANTYFDGTAFMGIGVYFTSAGAPDAAGRFSGFLDETRFTVGTARYTSDFTPPTAPFPTGIGDADWADVVLLLTYDGTPIADSSSFARTVTLAAPNVTSLAPADKASSYLVLNQRPAWDDTFMEAALLPATGTFTFEGLPTATETIVVGATTYTWRAAVSTANDVLIGASIAACVSNIIAAINAGAGEGTIYGTGTVANVSAGALEFLSPQFTLQAATAGAAGNSTATTETMADGFFNAATLTGGYSVPAPSNFAIERLPLDATGVLGLQITSRAYKTDAGSAEIRFDLVGPGSAVDTGTAANVDLNPAWVRQVFEEDPDTSAALTPSTINAGRIRFVRTV